MPKKEKVGKIVSSRMEKTIVVAVEEKHSHGKYGKIQNRTVRFKAHDPLNEGCEGDLVRIIESRPFSKDKTWRLIEILKHTQEATSL